MKTAVLFLLALSVFGAEKAPDPPRPLVSPAAQTIHITLGELRGAQPALHKLFGFDVPVNDETYTLRKNVTLVDAEMDRFEAQRLVLVKKHGKVVNGQLTVLPENMEAFSEDFAKLMSIKVDLSIIRVPISMLKDVKLSIADMSHLEQFLTQ